MACATCILLTAQCPLFPVLGPGCTLAHRPATCRRMRSEAAAFEELMFDWDSAFEAFCEDTEKAALMARLADEGYRQHGRGEGGCPCPASLPPHRCGRAREP